MTSNTGEMMKTKELGTLYPAMKELSKGESGVMFMQMSAGTATCGKKKYSIGTCVGSGAMIICSNRTGRQFVMSWNDLLNIAIERGIDGKKSIPNPRSKKDPS